MRLKIFPPDKGYLPYIFVANISIPLYFMFQEPTEKLYVGLLLILIILLAYRQVYWSPHLAILFIAIEMGMTLTLAYLFNPMYLYIIFIFVYQIATLPIRTIYIFCGIFTFSCIFILFKFSAYHQLQLLMSLLPPLFGGSIMPLIMKASFRYKEISKQLEITAKELEDKNKELLLIEESKKKMLADISHDLKTPITTIQGYSKALYEGMVSTPDQEKKYLKYIYDKSIRVSTLIDDLFMFSKLDNPEFPTCKEERDICEFVRQVMVEYYDLIDEKGMNLLVDIPNTKIVYSFDQKLFYRVISNLLENALKYNPKHTKILVKVRKSTDQIEIEMADNGIEIPEEIANRLFEAFFRGDRNRSDNGTGLGLSISKKIVELHNGKILLQTNLPRWEKKFVMILPIKQ